jgi:hypothetical protein
LPTRPNPSRRELLTLAAALAGVTLTAAAAVAGLTRRPAADIPTVPTVHQPSSLPAPAEPQELGG